MGAGFFYSYHLGWTRVDAGTLLGDLEAEGLRPAHPVTGRIVLVGREAASAGARSPVSREQLLSMAGLETVDEISVRLWMGGELGVLLRIRRAAGGAVAAEFGLGELPAEEMEAAVRAVRRAVGRASLLCVGFVIDRRGLTAGTNWERVVVAGTAYIDECPDALAVREQIASEHPQLAVMESAARSPWRVFGSGAPDL